jgi:hypothetical protein
MFYGSRVTSSLGDSEDVSSIVDAARDPGSQALPAGALRVRSYKVVPGDENSGRQRQ